MKKLLLLLTAVITLALSGYAQNRTVTGTVVDSETDEPLIGATVLPLGGGVGTATNVDGQFSLSIPAHVKDIQVSYVGYATQKVKVEPVMTVKLVNNNALKEVVVTGYGSGKKLGSIVGAVSVVGEDALENIPTATFLDALQGQVSGLSIYSDSGDPSSTDNSIRLRGVNSIYAGNTPLFILDGAPISQSLFTTLNPSDIESVTVLKDAASVAIYGSRAANGVIVITSKKGRFGERAQVTLRASYGWQQLPSDKVDMMNSEQYIAYRDAIGQPVTQEARDAWEIYGINTDWQKETFDSSAPTYSIEAAVQGGTENLSYYVSLNHFDSEGIMVNSKMHRETLRFSLNARVNNWLRIGLASNLGYMKYQNNNANSAVYSGSGVYGTNPSVFARKALPLDSPYYWTVDENGNIQYGEKALVLHFTGGQITPEMQVYRQAAWRNRVTLNTTLSEQINPVKGLTIRAQQNVEASDSRLDNVAEPYDAFVTPMGDTYDPGANGTGINQQSFSRSYSFTYTNTAEYTFTLNDLHNITVLAGEESIISRGNSFGLYTTGFADARQLLLSQGTDIQISNVSESRATQTFNSIFFNASYDFDNKYFFEANFRRDGSSKFAPGHRWSNFWSVGGMWNMKAEKFLAPYTWLDDLKFHISYGTTGNSSIGNYGYFGLVGSMVPYDGVAGAGIVQAANPDLSWETVRSFDVGFNFGFINIFTGEIDFYNKNTVDMLMSIPWSYTTGFGAGLGNIGSMRNTGVDVNVTAAIIKTKDWYWDVRANFNYNHNEITKLFDGQDELALPESGLKYQVGHSAGELYAVRWAGIDPRDGAQMWYDKDGNLTKEFNEERDAVLIGKSYYAPWSGGFGTTLRWKGLMLKADFNWAAKKYMTNNDRYFIENNNFGTSWNQMTSMLNVWQEPGQITDIPAVGQVMQFDTHLVENASFVRLKNLTLQYSLPAPLLSRLYLQGLTVHFTGRNLFTITDFTGYDPEPETNVITYFYPNTRQYEVGLEVTF